jgi:hypothetical protein
MATIDSELNELRRRVEQLETGLRQIAHKVDFDPRSVPLAVAKPAKSPADMTRAELHVWLLEQGLIIEPSPEVQAHAQAWAALSAEEQAAVRWGLDHLPPGPMVSDIIIQNRR